MSGKGLIPLAFTAALLQLSALNFSTLIAQANEQSSKIPVTEAATVDQFRNSEVERLTADGLGRFSQGDFKGAITEYTNAININPKRGGLFLQRGLTYLELENYNAALSDLNQAYELDKA